MSTAVSEISASAGGRDHGRAGNARHNQGRQICECFKQHGAIKSIFRGRFAREFIQLVEFPHSSFIVETWIWMLS